MSSAKSVSCTVTRCDQSRKKIELARWEPGRALGLKAPRKNIFALQTGADRKPLRLEGFTAEFSIVPGMSRRAQVPRSSKGCSSSRCPPRVGLSLCQTIVRCCVQLAPCYPNDNESHLNLWGRSTPGTRVPGYPGSSNTGGWAGDSMHTRVPGRVPGYPGKCEFESVQSVVPHGSLDIQRAPS
eukprot:2879688-Rhodomonas_salina.1